MTKVCISGRIHAAAKNALEASNIEVHEWIGRYRPDAKRLAEFCGSADGLISLWTDRIDEHLFSACPNLKVVCNYAAGHNNINIEDARKAGVSLCYTPDVLTKSTAEFTLALMLSLARKVVSSHKFVLSGKWDEFDPLGHLGIDLRNKTLGILGMGKIGQEVTRMAKLAFNMEIIYVSRSRKLQAEELFKAKKVELDDLLRQSDVISIHVDLNDSTKHLLDRQAFAQLKPEALLINTSRGSVINEKELINGLKEKNSEVQHLM